MMKRFLTLFLLFPSLIWSQDYLDVFKLGLNHNFASEFENTEFVTTVNSVNFSARTLTKRFETDGPLFGLDFYYNKVQLFPNSKPVDLYSTTLVLGYIKNFKDRLSMEVLLKPKLASDYQEINSRDLYIGGSVILRNHVSRRLHYRYGLYASTEAYGLITTPVFGFYYLSDDNDFEADVTLPLSADINYKLQYYTLGFQYQGINQSFRVYEFDDADVYAEQKRLEFAAYFKLRTLSEKAWAKAMIGYAFNSLDVYNTNDKIDFYFIDFAIDNRRNQLNPNLRGSMFFKVELIYRLPF